MISATLLNGNVVFFMALVFISRLQPPGFFVKPPHLDTIVFARQGFAKKNLAGEASRKIFSANPLGHGLDGKRMVQKFASQKAKRFFGDIENHLPIASKSPKKLAADLSCSSTILRANSIAARIELHLAIPIPENLPKAL